MLGDPNVKVFDPQHRSEELELFHRTHEALRRLYKTIAEASVKIEPPLLLKEPTRFSTAGLGFVERHAFAPAETAGPLTEVELIEGPDRRGEVDAAARLHSRAAGARPRLRDIGILVRDLDLYHELIAASFSEHDLPFFVDRRRTAAHFPLLQLAPAVLQIARGDWPHDAVMSLLKSGLAGITLDEADELENYVLLHRIKGSAWASREAWKFNRTLTRDESDDLPPAETIELDHIDRLRRTVFDNVAPFVHHHRSAIPRPVRDTIDVLFQLFETLGCEKRCSSGWPKRPPPPAMNSTTSTSRSGPSCRTARPDGRSARRSAASIWGISWRFSKSGLESVRSRARRRRRVDQVLVGQVDRTRTPRLNTAIVLGLNEGTFPRTAREDSVLSDNERRSLRRRGFDIDPDSTRRLLDENLFGYIAFTGELASPDHHPAAGG